MVRSKWEYKKLQDICEKGSSNIAQNKIEDNTGDYALYGASGYVKSIDFYHQEQPYIGVVKDGSGVGRANLYPAKSSLLGTMQYIFPKNGCDLGYLLYVLQGLHLEKYKTGAAIPHIYFKDYGKCEVPYPPIADQQRIVAELDCLNEMIAVKQEQLKEFDKLAQSIFYDMFGDPVSNEKGWDIIKLGDICSCITKGTTPTTLGFPFVEEGINFVKVESFVDGKIDSSKLTHITHECHQALSRSQLESEDLLICIAGATIGKMAFVDASILPANTNQACAIVRLKDKNNLRFIHYFLALKLKNDIMKMGKGVAQPNLSLGQLRNFTISLPPLSLQQQFAEKISAIEAQKKLVKQSIAETQALLDYTMDKYFG